MQNEYIVWVDCDGVWLTSPPTQKGLYDIYLVPDEPMGGQESRLIGLIWITEDWTPVQP